MLRGLGKLGSLREFWRITRELSPKAIEIEAQQSFRLAVLGAADVDKSRVSAALAPENSLADGLVQTADLPEDRSEFAGLPAADLYVYVADVSHGISIADVQWLDLLEASGRPVVLAAQTGGNGLIDDASLADYAYGPIPLHRIAILRDEDPSAIAEKIVLVIIDTVPGLELALGRRLPEFRERVANKIIMETARVNAEFAFFSSIPSNIPILGEIVAPSADLIVLTKNQIMMLFKLAAIYGRRLDTRLGVAAEIAPVVGGAFLWRTLARTLLGFVPGILSAVPKTTVAFVGTYVVGSAALYYYRYGQNPSRQAMKEFQRDAVNRVRAVVPALRGKERVH